MSPELQFAIETARRAGDIVQRWYKSGFDVNYKMDESPVTKADQEAEASIREQIERSFPNDSILGEEYGSATGTSSRRWIIDPIDGTRSFVYGVPLFGVLVGLEADGEAILGVAHFPALEQTFWGSAAGGAFQNGKQISVSRRESLDGCLAVCGSLRSLSNTARLDGIVKLSERVAALRNWGDAFGHCLVANGTADLMIDPAVQIWDTCAVAAIVVAAGGTFTNFRGEPGHQHGEAIAANPRLLNLALECFGQ